MGSQLQGGHIVQEELLAKVDGSRRRIEDADHHRTCIAARSAIGGSPEAELAANELEDESALRAKCVELYRWLEQLDLRRCEVRVPEQIQEHTDRLDDESVAFGG